MLQKTYQTWKYMKAMKKIPKFNKRRAFDKTVGPGKDSQINQRRAYVYSGLQSRHQQLCASSYFLLSLYLGHCYINPTFLSRFSKITGQIQMIIIYIFSFAITPVSDNDDIMEIYLKLRKTTKNYWPKNMLIYLLQG